MQCGIAALPPNMQALESPYLLGETESASRQTKLLLCKRSYAVWNCRTSSEYASPGVTLLLRGNRVGFPSDQAASMQTQLCSVELPHFLRICKPWSHLTS